MGREVTSPKQSESYLIKQAKCHTVVVTRQEITDKSKRTLQIAIILQIKLVLVLHGVVVKGIPLSSHI